MFNYIIEFKSYFNSLKNLKHIKKYYTGEVDSNNLPNGFGTCIKKYIKYTGEWKNGFPYGKGITIYKMFDLYFLTNTNLDKLQTFKHEGNIKNGLFDGIGILKRNNKLFYKGEFKDGVITGKGELYNDKETIMYNGDFINGKFDGKGILYNSNGELLYTGEWYKGEKDGYGLLYNPNISKSIPKYDGYWKNNMFNGEGKLNEKNAKRIGYFENNKQEGNGTFNDGIRKYTGLFKNHMFNGYGDLIVNDNNKIIYNYSGNFLDNNFNGNGFIQYKNNNTYNGNFKNNLKNGIGTFYDYKNNYKIETTWLKDKKNGSGTILYNDGNGFKCTWKNDKLISKKRLMVYENDNLQITLRKKKKVPYELKCPISLEIMKDPVICSDGHTYDRASINTLFKKNNFISPTTREKLNKNIIITNYNIKKMIDNFK
tara:strand:- start:452 stop:1729 length:1278 start_codon:yes stop_codon:yes gene_type:complete